MNAHKIEIVLTEDGTQPVPVSVLWDLGLLG